MSSSQYTFWTESDKASYRLTDGETASGGWLAGNRDANPIVLIDLGEVRQISRVELFVFVTMEKRFPGSATIEVSADGVTWTQVFSSQITAGADGSASCGFDKADARYVRITASDVRSARSGYTHNEPERHAARASRRHRRTRRPGCPRLKTKLKTVNISPFFAKSSDKMPFRIVIQYEGGLRYA